MSKGKVAPIQKTYGDAIHTMDQQLAKNGYQRYPGTTEMFLPYKEASGKYRTGLDPKAPYLERLFPNKEDRDAEIDRIVKTKARLEEALGVPGILEPTSIFYNFAATKEQLVKKFGTDLHTSPVKLGTSEEFFDLSGNDIMKEIAWYWLKVHPRIAPSLDAYKRGLVPSDVKYYVVDDEAENRETYTKKKEINKAVVAFEGLGITRRKQIARLMGLPVIEDTTEEVVYNLLDNKLKESEYKDGANKGLSPVKLFLDLLNMTEGRIKIKDLVEQALQHSVYRHGQGGKILEGGVPVATSKEELIEHLLDENNQIDLIALEKKLNIKKIEKV